MKKIIPLLLLFTACATPPEVPTPLPSPVAPPKDTRAEILKIADSSACASYSWKNRGRAPAGYIRGMALAYARALKGSKGLAAQAVGSADRDALAWYGLNPKSESEALRMTWTLLIGLGMRESSGRWCCGRDSSATNVGHETTEAGAFQASYNSSNASPVVKQIYLDAKAGDAECNLDVWKAGVNQASCAPVDKLYGTGEGVNFQKLSKLCPGFAAEYTASLIRVLRKHFGPLNRKEAEIVPACSQMLETIEGEIK